MKALARWLATTVAALVVGAASVFAAYDILAFQGRRHEIAALLAAASPQEQSLPMPVAQLIEASLSGRVSAHASRLLFQDLKVTPLLGGMGGFHLTSALWWACTSLHLSRAEQLTLIASRSSTGVGQKGYSAEAGRRFGRDLSGLNLQEAATVVASSWAPYDNSGPALQGRRNSLLSKLGRGT